MLVKLKFISFQLMSFVAKMDGLDDDDMLADCNRRKVRLSNKKS